MSFIAKMQLDGEALNVVQCSFRFAEATDVSGMPTSVARGGFIKLVVESSASTFLFDWMISQMGTKSGHVTFYKRDALSTLNKLEFTDAYCVEYYETFNHKGDDPMQIELRINAGNLKLNGSEYPGSRSDEKEHQQVTRRSSQTFSQETQPESIALPRLNGQDAPLLNINPDDVQKGTIDESEKAFSAEEKRIAETLASEGKNVKAKLEATAGRMGDAEVDGIPTEFKSLDEGATGATIKNSINNSIRRGGQARSMILDARGSGLTEEEALKGLNRSKNITRGKIDSVRILGDGFDKTENEFK